MDSPSAHYARTPDGISIAYTITGAGPPLVYLQPGSHAELEWHIPEQRAWLELLGRSHTLIRIDERGTGLSSRSVDDWSVDAQASDVTAVVERLRLGGFNLFAVSSRTAIALRAAAVHSTSVGRILLWNPIGGEALTAASRIRAAHVLADVDQELAFEVLARIHADERPEMVPDLVAYMRDTWGEFGFAIHSGVIRNTDISALGAEVRAPVLIVHTRDHSYWDVETARRLAASTPNASLVLWDGRAAQPAHRGDLERKVAIANGFFEIVAPATEARTAQAESDGQSQHRATAPYPAGLSEREVEVLRLLAEGRSNAGIAEELVIAQATVARHVSNILNKTGLSNRTQAAAFAVAHGLVGGQPTNGSAPAL